MTELLWATLALVGVIGSAVCSGLETGVYSVSRIAVGARAEREDRRARTLLGEIGRRESVLGALLIGNNIFNYAGSLGIAGLLAAAGLGEIGVVVVSAAVLTPVLVVFAESYPKELFRQHADRLMPGFAPLLRAGRLLLTATGVLPSVVWLAGLLARATGAEAAAGLATGARQRVAVLLSESRGLGLISAEQASLVERALVFGQRVVADELVPWTEVVSIGVEWDRARIARALDRSAHGRVPVVDRRRRVVGVVGAIDLMLDPDRSVEELMKPALFLEADLAIDEALPRLAEARLAVVGTSDHPLGVVTTKDLVEPLTGELQAW